MDTEIKRYKTKKRYIKNLLTIDKYLCDITGINFDKIERKGIYSRLKNGTLRSKLSWKKDLAQINGYNLNNLL